MDSGMAGWLLSLERKGKTQLWRTSEESVLIAVRGVGFIVAVGVGDTARGDKVACSEAAVTAMVCRPIGREKAPFTIIRRVMLRIVGVCCL